MKLCESWPSFKMSSSSNSSSSSSESEVEDSFNEESVECCAYDVTSERLDLVPTRLAALGHF